MAGSPSATNFRKCSGGSSWPGPEESRLVLVHARVSNEQKILLRAVLGLKVCKVSVTNGNFLHSSSWHLQSAQPYIGSSNYDSDSNRLKSQAR